MADRQRSRVYAWEDRAISPHDASIIAFPAAQGIVDAIWSEMGLLYPPRVERLPFQARCRIADADRLTIRMPQTIPSWCLLHEIAHAMTTTIDGHSDGHGSAFMNVYLDLLVRYLRLNAVDVRLDAVRAGLKICSGASKAFFVDCQYEITRS